MNNLFNFNSNTTTRAGDIVFFNANMPKNDIVELYSMPNSLVYGGGR